MNPNETLYEDVQFKLGLLIKSLHYITSATSPLEFLPTKWPTSKHRRKQHRTSMLACLGRISVPNPNNSHLFRCHLSTSGTPTSSSTPPNPPVASCPLRTPLVSVVSGLGVVHRIALTIHLCAEAQPAAGGGGGGGRWAHRWKSGPELEVQSGHSSTELPCTERSGSRFWGWKVT